MDVSLIVETCHKSLLDMLHAFSCEPSVNQRVDCLDVSHVENMYGMFVGARAFNQPLNLWDVSNVGYDLHVFSSFFLQAALGPMGCF
jgi:hypothetical protein